MNLIKPEHDLWEPGEHNGTFRGNNLAFVTAKKAIEEYWLNETKLTSAIQLNSQEIHERLSYISLSTSGKPN